MSRASRPRRSTKRPGRLSDTNRPTRQTLNANRYEQSCVAEFGSAFLRDYGWAAPLFNDTAPKFKQLQKRVELDHWRGYYRMASHGTHANPKGISWNIQSLATVEMIWAGPSNAGLVDPAQCTLIALASITVGLLAYSVGEVPDSEIDVVDKSVALVR